MINSLYPAIKVNVVHQGSALLESVLKYDDHSHENTMFCLVDRGVLHVMVSAHQKLIYYNQFPVRKSEEYLKYIMTVFKEVGMNQKRNKVIMWGTLKQQSQHVELLKKYIREISYGSKPKYLKFSHHFDEIPDHLYFDVYGIYLCE